MMSYNIHDLCSAPLRKVGGRVEVTYNNPFVTSQNQKDSTGDAYNSNIDQISNGIVDSPTFQPFLLCGNDLSGNYKVIDNLTEVGWISDRLSDMTGSFFTPVAVGLVFPSKLIERFEIIADVTRNVHLIDFDVVLYQGAVEYAKIEVRNYASLQYTHTTSYPDITSINLVIYRISRPHFPACIMEFNSSSTIRYDESQLMSIDLLEELSYEDDKKPLGRVSANELIVTFSNENQEFYFNNPTSLIAQQLKKNRKIVPFLSIQDPDGVWHERGLGTFWSYNWNVPVRSLTAVATAFDTLGLLNTITFFPYSLPDNTSVGTLFETIFNDAIFQFPDLQYYIHPDLYNIIIPKAWFKWESHLAAIKRIAGCDFINVYCDRNSVVRCVPQKMVLSDPVAVWSDGTNGVSKSYPTMYTDPLNLVEVDVNTISLQEQEVLSYSKVLTLTDAFLYKQQFNYTAPVANDSGVVITMDADPGVTWTADLGSAGIVFWFSGTGQVRSISITGTAIIENYDTTVISEDKDAQDVNGELSTNVQSPFIQTIEHAQRVATELLNRAQEERFTAEVVYRGDIELSTDDTIQLLDGIAPTDLYVIHRHTLYWDGFLRGTAQLRT